MVEVDKSEPRRDLNIVLLPNVEVRNKALSFSYQITRRCKSYFQLDSERYLPHISLYQGEYPERNIEDLFVGLADNIDSGLRTNVAMNGFRVSRGSFVWWNCQNPQTLQPLHDQVLACANPLREGLVAPNVRDLWKTLTPDEKESVNTTGSILNGTLFSPHIALARLADPSDSQFALALLQGYDTDVSFFPQTLAIAQMGQHGTISKIVEEIPLN